MVGGWSTRGGGQQRHGQRLRQSWSSARELPCRRPAGVVSGREAARELRPVCRADTARRCRRADSAVACAQRGHAAVDRLHEAALPRPERLGRNRRRPQQDMDSHRPGRAVQQRHLGERPDTRRAAAGHGRLDAAALTPRLDGRDDDRERPLVPRHRGLRRPRVHAPRPGLHLPDRLRLAPGGHLLDQPGRDRAPADHEHADR